jgi:hypothetical protein
MMGAMNLTLVKALSAFVPVSMLLGYVGGYTCAVDVCVPATLTVTRVPR